MAVIAALLLEGSFLWIACIAGSVVPSVLLLLLSHAIYAVTVYHVLRHGLARSIIIPAALVFRVTVSTVPAPATDDLYRYRWEAMVQNSGGNPYEARPSSGEWAPLRDSVYPQVPAKDFKSGYGPGWELLARWTLSIISSATTDPRLQALWMKAPAALFDLGIMWALWILLRIRRLPESRVLIYAWAPFPIWEFWVNGHNDAVLVFFLVACLAFAAAARPTLGALALGLAIAVKWWPAMLLPSYARRHGIVRTLATAAVSVGALALPFLTDPTENARFLSGFIGGWRNNDSLFGFLLLISGGDLYRAKYLAFALIACAILWLTFRVWPLERIWLWAIVSLLLISANCHPWYLTWFLPLLAFYPHPSLLLWVSIVSLAYQVRIAWTGLGEWNGSTPDRWWIYGPVFACMLWEFWQSRRKVLTRSRETADQLHVSAVGSREFS